jgi:hypothetical protein
MVPQAGPKCIYKINMGKVRPKIHRDEGKKT